MNMNGINDPFYIGWEAKTSIEIRKVVRRTVALLLVAGLGAALVLSCAQRLVGRSVFEWGHKKSFSGILKTAPYPHLLVPRPGKIAYSTANSSYYLVGPWKFGLNKETLATFDGKPVSLKGTLIYREDQTMIEVEPESITNSPIPTRAVPRESSPANLGTMTLRGEIVDSKCFFGVMNPGQLIPHRACAIRCISGGIPPVLLVRPQGKSPQYYLLVSTNGTPVNKQVLDFVAEPVEVVGQVEQQGDILILRADPESFHRL